MIEVTVDEKYEVRVKDSQGSLDAKKFLSELLPNGGLLPAHCMYFTQSVDNAYCVLHFPPQVRSVSWDYDRTSGMFNLAFPHVLLACRAYKEYGGSFWSAGICNAVYTVESPREKTKLYITNLPNVSGGAEGVCIGPSIRERGLTAAINKAAVAFWERDFNTGLSGQDGVHSYNKARKPRFTRNVEEWQRRSAEDPLFVLNGRYWIKLKSTVKDLMRPTTHPGVLFFSAAHNARRQETRT